MALLCGSRVTILAVRTDDGLAVLTRTSMVTRVVSYVCRCWLDAPGAARRHLTRVPIKLRTPIVACVVTHRPGTAALFDSDEPLVACVSRMCADSGETRR